MGVGLSLLFAPHSSMALVVSLMMLPMAFFIGFYAWAGAALVTGLIGLIAKLLRPRSKSGGRVANEPRGEIPSGTFGFVVTSLLCSILCGLLVSFVAEGHVFFLVMGTYGLSGFGYGHVVHWAARTGRLPFPSES